MHAHVHAYRELVAGRRAAARRAVRRLKRELLRLERAARRLCRSAAPGDMGPLPWRPAPERLSGCETLLGVVAINDALEDHLDPADPAPEQMDGLDRLAVLARRLLGLRLARSPLARLSPVRLPVTDLRLALTSGGRARGASSFATCLPRGRRRVLGREAGAVSHSLALVAGRPVVAWQRDCSVARPTCGRDSIAWQRLTPEGGLVSGEGSAGDTGVDVGEWSQGEPFALRSFPGGAALIFGSDGDQLVQLLDGHMRRRGPARVVLAHSRGVSPGRFAAWPGPAWLSVADQGHRVSVLRMDREHRRPVSRVRLLDEEQGPGAFGEPALLGGPAGYAVAVTTQDSLLLARLGPQGLPKGPARRVALGRRRTFDPLCVAMARAGERLWVLAVGRGVGRTGSAVLLGLDRSAPRFVLAKELELPMRVARSPSGGCKLWLLPTRRHLVLVALEEARPGASGERLLAVEYKRDGRLAARPSLLATVARVGGVVPVSEGFLVSFTEPVEGDAARDGARPVTVSRYRCR